MKMRVDRKQGYSMKMGAFFDASLKFSMNFGLTRTNDKLQNKKEETIITYSFWFLEIELYVLYTRYVIFFFFG